MYGDWEKGYRGGRESALVSEPLSLCVLCMYRAGDRRCMGTGRGDTEGGGAQHSSQSHCHCVCYVCTGLAIGSVWGLGEGVQRGAGLSTRLRATAIVCVMYVQGWG